MEQRFAQRLVVVTGANGGLGRAVVRAFLDEGARVAAVARGSLALTELPSVPGAADRLRVVAADLTNEGDAAAAVRAILEWAGRLDVLVNTVGGFRGGHPLADSSRAEWQQMLDSNLLAVVEVLRAVLPVMLERGGGRIINVSSRAARAIGPNVAAYTAAKAGLEALTLAAAAEYREHGITVNAVAPSTIATSAMLHAATAEERRRWVAPESVAGVILFLASEAAADVSGAIVPVYGRA